MVATLEVPPHRVVGKSRDEACTRASHARTRRTAAGGSWNRRAHRQRLPLLFGKPVENLAAATLPRSSQAHACGTPIVSDHAPASSVPRAGWSQPAAGTVCNATGGGSVARQRTASAATKVLARATTAAAAPCLPTSVLLPPWPSARCSLPQPSCNGDLGQLWQRKLCMSACRPSHSGQAPRYIRCTYCRAISSTEGMVTVPSDSAHGRRCSRSLNGRIHPSRKGTIYTRSRQLA